MNKLTLNSEQRKHTRKAISRKTIRTSSARNDTTMIRIRDILNRAYKHRQISPRKDDHRRRGTRP
jgi:hypothetical protein